MEGKIFWTGFRERGESGAGVDDNVVKFRPLHWKGLRGRDRR